MEQIHINDKGALNLLNNLNPHKACGPDNINSRVMKDLKDFVFRNISVCIIIYGGKLYRMLCQNP
jgi:hypothetical protein